MNHIYHEKQEGSLCGQHCLNNLLQGQFFTAVELAEIGQQMDQEETQFMAEGGTNTEDFRKFLQQPSSNMDDSGMFSVQVLSTALKVWDLTLVSYTSTNPVAKTARDNPIGENAYICNFKMHWFTVRKLGHQWFNLNSLLAFPELISDTYLSLFLTQLIQEGYSIFITSGELPPSVADDALKNTTAKQTIKPNLLYETASTSKSLEDEELAKAVRASLRRAGVDVASDDDDDDDSSLVAAMNLSLEQHRSQTAASPSSGSTGDNDLERAIQLSLGAASLSPSASKDAPTDAKEARQLEAALQLSLNSAICEVTVPENLLEPDLDEIRRKRLEKLGKK